MREEMTNAGTHHTGYVAGEVDVAPVRHLVVATATEPALDGSLRPRTPAQQNGHDSDAAELRAVNAGLVEANGRLRAVVHDLERRWRVHEAFSVAAAAGAGGVGVVEALHRLTGLSVAAEDRFGNLVAWAGPGRPDPYPRWSARRRGELVAEAGRVPGPLRQGGRVIALAGSREEVLGALVLLDPRRGADEYALFALEQGATMLGVELAHQHSLAENELRLHRDVVEDLLAGVDEAGVLARARALGHDLGAEHRVVVICWPGAGGGEVLADAARQAVSRVFGVRALTAQRPDGVVLVVPVEEPGGGDRRWEELHRVVAGSVRGVPGAIGVGGRCTGPAQVPRSHAEATRAVGVRLRSSAAVGVTLYDRLGIYRLLTADGNDDEVRCFVQEWLGPLLAYDASNGSALVTTLWQYLECGGNYDATARVLVIHRSTLRYRLRRIRDISGLDLGDVSVRFNLHIATRAHNVLRGRS